MTVTNRVRTKTREIPGEARHKIAAAPGPPPGSVDIVFAHCADFPLIRPTPPVGRPQVQWRV